MRKILLKGYNEKEEKTSFFDFLRLNGGLCF